MGKDLKVYSKKALADLYEKRFMKGYMDEWPLEKKQRVMEIIGLLGLPPIGDALDFGCGNGVLTDIVRRALPGWNIYGTDISKTAILNARERYPLCNFFFENNQHRNKLFDFVFSNHVFEHVYDLNETFSHMIDYLKPGSSMLHILPCGNKGSFERDICLLRKDGIDGDRENRFFFEVKGHLRRLTTEQFKSLAEEYNFYLDKEYYTNQYYGALEWITASNIAFVLKFTNCSRAINHWARKKLIRWRYFLIVIYLLRKIAQDYFNFPAKNKANALFRITHILKIPLIPIPYLVDHYFKYKSEQEWRNRKSDPKGSEMHLYFKRDIAF